MGSGLQDEQIARNDLGGADPDDGAPPGERGLAGTVSARSFASEIRARHSVKKPIPALSRSAARIASDFDALPERRGDDRRGEEEQDDETAKLGERETPQGRLGMLAHRVGPDASEPASRFVVAQSRRPDRR